MKKLLCREQTNCPNCGMPITSDKCEYCGTSFLDIANINTMDRCKLRIKHNGQVFEVDTYVGSLDIEMHPLMTYATDFDGTISIKNDCKYTINISFISI